MKSSNNFINNNTENIFSIHEKNNISDLNHLTYLKGIISGDKDSKTLEIENELNINKIPTKKPSLNEILEKKDIFKYNWFICINKLLC